MPRKLSLFSVPGVEKSARKEFAREVNELEELQPCSRRKCSLLIQLFGSTLPAESQKQEAEKEEGRGEVGIGS